ncbi:MAG: tetratricopeptide repeat protein [Thermoanaerobaculia bacterium]
MTSQHKSWGIAAACLAVAAVSAALFLLPRRQVTTASDGAYREFVAGNDDYDRMYFADARRHYENALSRDPKFMMAMVRIGLVEFYEGYGNTAKAQEVLEAANRLRGRVTRRERLALDLARAWVNRRNDEASRIARTLKQDYQDELGYQWLAEDALRLGRTEDAAALFRERLARDPNNAQAYNYLGYLEATRGNMTEALADLQRYAFIAPDSADPLDTLGQVETAHGDYEAAIRHFQKAQSLKPNFFGYPYRLGIAHEKRGDFALARSDLDRAFGLAQMPVEKFLVAQRLFIVSLREKDFPRAREAIQAMRDANLPPKLGGVEQFFEATLLSDEGRAKEADELLSSVTWKDPDPVTQAEIERQIRLTRGRIAFRDGRYRDALRLLESALTAPGEALDLDKQSSVIRYRAILAQAQARLGDFDSAEKVLALNRKFNPRDLDTIEAEAEVARLKKAA